MNKYKNVILLILTGVIWGMFLSPLYANLEPQTLLRSGKVDAAELQEAKQWIRSAAERGMAEAQFFLGIFIAQEKDGERVLQILQAYHELDKYFVREEDKGMRDTIQFIRGKYEERNQILSDLDRATVLFRQAAEKGNASYLLGRIFLEGFGVMPSRAEAARWFRKSAEQGDALAKRVLERLSKEGDIQDNVIVLPEDEEDPTMLNFLSEPFYASSSDLEAARQWLLKMAGQGMAEAQTLRGICLSMEWDVKNVWQLNLAYSRVRDRYWEMDSDKFAGQPVDEKMLKALRVVIDRSDNRIVQEPDVLVCCLPILFRRYVESDTARRAPFFLGVILYRGDAVASSSTEGVYWFLKSAVRGYAEGQFTLCLALWLHVEKALPEFMKEFFYATFQWYVHRQGYFQQETK